MLELIPLAITGLILWATVLLGNKSKWGWIVYGAINLLWIVYGSFQTPYAWGIVASAFFNLASVFYGLWRWEHSK